MDEDWFYRKRGRYYERAVPFDGWPADGIWMVSRGQHSATLMTKVGDIPDIGPVVPLWKYKDEITDVLIQPLTPAEAFEEICAIVSKGESPCHNR